VNHFRLYAIVFRLAAIRPGAIPDDHGDQARSALFDLIRRGDLPLAEKLHDQNIRKPYTISLLRGGKRGRDRAAHFGEGDNAWWRFTLLHEPAFEALLRRYVLSRTLPHVRIGAVEFAVVDAFASGVSHPDSGHISIQELQSRWDCPPEVAPDRFILDFQAPTVFSLGTDDESGERRWCAMPNAPILFSTLRKKWAYLGGAEPGDEFDHWVRQHVEVEPLNLQSRTVVVERRPVTGFQGHVRFRIRGDRRWLPLLHLLADLTFWTGVGYQTTRGMGRVQRLLEE
jgi:CRISPR-associated endoribonuclease Cas6